MEQDQLVEKIARKLANETGRNQAIHLHKYVIGLIVVLMLFFATFPLACLRVSTSEKYGGKPFNSLDLQDHQRTKIN